MNAQAFKVSEAEPPAGPSPALIALRHLARDEWEITAAALLAT